jgi:hypothetical protein
MKLQQAIVGVLKRHLRNTLRNIWLDNNFFSLGKREHQGTLRTLDMMLEGAKGTKKYIVDAGALW